MHWLVPVLALLSIAAAVKQNSKPNIIFILADDLVRLSLYWQHCHIIKFCDLKFNKIALHLLKYLLHYVDVFAVCKIHFLLKDQHPVY